MLVGAGGDHPDAALTVTFPGGRPVRLRGRHDLWLIVSHGYRIVEATAGADRWRVTSAAYAYELVDERERTLLAYHWHPFGASYVKTPHLHIGSAVTTGQFMKRHLPTGRVALEEVIRFVIRELDVEPLESSWEEILTETEAEFLARRTWPAAGSV